MSSKVTFYIDSKRCQLSFCLGPRCSTNTLPEDSSPVLSKTSFLHANGITGTPTPRSACTDTNPVFLSIRQGYRAGDCQIRKEVGSERKTTLLPPPPPQPCAPRFLSLTQTCTGVTDRRQPRCPGNRFARPTALGCHRHISRCRRIWERPTQPFKRQIVGAHSISTLS